MDIYKKHLKNGSDLESGFDLTSEFDLKKEFKPKKEIDLSAFGIFKTECAEEYFCTPKGANIIGVTGVDGIHYCTVKSLGSTIFAVAPMGDYGRYVFPVANDLTEFLRVLMACGDEACVEQAHIWDEEKFDSFKKENPTTEAAQDMIRYLKKEYGLSPMERPLGYLKELYEGFDYGSIPYTEEYYDIVPEEKPQEPWQVRFSLHSKSKREKAGEELKINKSFSWAEYEWTVPSAYICSKGIVLDIFAKADKEKTEAFLFRTTYAVVQRGDDQNEDPFAFDYDPCVIVNGKKLHCQMGTGDCWADGYESFSSAEMKEKLCHYGLDLDEYWIWRRVSFPWETSSKPKVKSIDLTLSQCPKSAKGSIFASPSVGEKITFTHPITGRSHTLTIEGYEKETINIPLQNDGYEMPSNMTAMQYSILPDMPTSRFSISDTRNNDMPRKTDKKKTDAIASAIGIIGGADGPTAVFVSSPQNGRYTALSALTFEPQETVTWQMIFREKTIEDITEKLL